MGKYSYVEPDERRARGFGFAVVGHGVGRAAQIFAAAYLFSWPNRISYISFWYGEFL